MMDLRLRVGVSRLRSLHAFPSGKNGENTEGGITKSVVKTGKGRARLVNTAGRKEKWGKGRSGKDTSGSSIGSLADTLRVFKGGIF
jgi:hypothetical protein